VKLSLFLSNLKLSRGTLIAWCSLIMLYGIFAVYLYPVISKSSMDYISYIASLPEAMRAVVGLGNIDVSSLAFTADTFVAVEFLMWWPVILCFYAIFAGVSISREVERGTLDLLLAQPVSRTRVLISKYANVLMGTMLITAASWLGIAAGAPLADVSVNLGNQALALLQGLLFVAAIGSYTLLASVIFLEPRKALAAAGVLTAAMYILNFIVPLLSHSFSWLAEVSFFHHYNAVQIVRSGALDWTAVIIFSATFLVCSVASIIIFRKRDLSV
jgi:ABC-2 type transport system permease protein